MVAVGLLYDSVHRQIVPSPRILIYSTLCPNGGRMGPNGFSGSGSSVLNYFYAAVYRDPIGSLEAAGGSLGAQCRAQIQVSDLLRGLHRILPVASPRHLAQIMIEHREVYSSCPWRRMADAHFRPSFKFRGASFSSMSEK